MNDVEPTQWEAEIKAVIHKLIEKELLTGECRVEVESLLEKDRYEAAGRIAVNNVSHSNDVAD